MNGTGPRGEGPMTGRGLGKCADASKKAPLGGRGRERGQGLGAGFRAGARRVANQDK